jgi:hypothetical protein
MIGGVRWLTAGGNPSAVKDAQSWITGAITGLIIGLASYLILYQINPNLVIFKPLRVKMVKEVAIASYNNRYSCSYAYLSKTEDPCPSGQPYKGASSNCDQSTLPPETGGYTNLACCCSITAQTGCSWKSECAADDNNMDDQAVETCGTSGANYHCCCSKSQSTGRGCSWGDSTCENNTRQVSNSGNCSGAPSGSNTTCCCSWGCSPATQGNCSQENLVANGWNCGNTDTASAVCRGESGGNVGSKSGADYCVNADGSRWPYSLGLFQINVKAHQNDGGQMGSAFPSSCRGLFSGGGNGSGCKMTGASSTYNTCVSDITNVNKNIQLACILKNQNGGFGDWSYYNNNCR